MGCFDSVVFDCLNPECKGHIQFQSKAGDCDLTVYFQPQVPVDIALDVDGDSTQCDKCGTLYTVNTSGANYANVWITEGENK